MMEFEIEENITGNSGNDLHSLFVAYYFPPMGLSGVQRTLKFVKYLPQNGWDVSVLTTDSPAYYAFDDSLIEDIDFNHTNIYRTPPDISRIAKPKNGGNLTYPSHFSQKLKRLVLQTIFQPDSRISWKKSAVKLGMQIIEENPIHTIYATAPPYTDFLVASELSKNSGLPYILDYRDLWVDNAYYYYVTPFHKSKAINLETKSLTYAKRIVVINRYMKEKLLQRYKFLSHEDISIIPHGYDEEDFAPFRNTKPDPNYFTITHSGLFPDDLTPKYFLKALSLYIKKNPEAKSKIKSVFIGLMRKSHLKMIKKYGLSDIVELQGYVPHNECIAEMMKADVLWMMAPNEIVTPSRLYEYIGARKPIFINISEGSIRQTALETEAAMATSHKNVNEIVEAIDHLYNSWRQGTLPKPNLSYAESFERKRLTTLLARELAFSANY